MLNRFMQKVVALMSMVLTIAVAACSPQSNQGVSPNAVKESKEIAESQQEGYMRIIGDLRWDELPNKEAWIKRFPGCFDNSGEDLASKFRDGNFRPLSTLPINCQINVGGFRIAPLFVETSLSRVSAKFSISKVSFMLVAQSQDTAFEEAIKKKYSETYLDSSYEHYNAVAGSDSPWYCSKFTCWYPSLLLATPTPSVISELNTAGLSTSEL